MQLPAALLTSLESVNGFDKDAFIKVHESEEQVTSIRMNPFKSSDVSRQSSVVKGELSVTHDSRLTTHEKIPWTEFGYYLETRPSFTFDPLFHAGCYYVQEASSMFLEQALKQTVDFSPKGVPWTKPVRVLDLCAAPGGKSTHLLSLISKDSLLVSNEVIRSRANILNDNIVKWGCGNVVVTNNDPEDFQQLENYFDVIVVDAPCSGSGLFRRDPEAMNEWSLNNVAHCSQRQQRILADVLPALKPGGVLIYSTCSYSMEEDENIIDWLTRELPIANCQLSIDNSWGIIPSGGGYRFWPDKVKGEGFFIACFRKNDAEDSSEFYKKPKPAYAKVSAGKPDKISQAEINILDNYVKKEGLAFIQMEKFIHAVPENLQGEIRFLFSKLRAVNFGIKIGEIIRDKLLPDHALAMSGIVSGNVSRVELDFEKAILYLKRREIKIATDQKGWSLVTYKDHPLGWINILPNRVNNYYPKELRILKD
jgi:16S rRNA C967 or C1407 C5-methylase (RsmB/RsmF family)/NOL1/NOP2/fmu family ribosome biogenesis protein